MVLITGANGRLGSAIVKHLNSISNQTKFIVSSSSKNGVDKLSNNGYNARLANFDDTKSLETAFEGINQLVLISTMDQNRFIQHKNVIDAAKIAGVKHIFYTSLSIQNIDLLHTKDLMISHFQTEEYLTNSGLDYTIFRNTMYAEALKELLIIEESKIKLATENGRVPFATIDELGEGIAHSILNEKNKNEILNLTGSCFYTFEEIIQLLSNMKEEKIHFSSISDEEYINFLLSAGYDDFQIYLNSSTIKDVKEKQYEIKDDSLENLLGRKTETAELFLKNIFK